MTNEEAILILNNLNYCCNAYAVEKAITMAIKALEQQPCEDAISRQGEKNISKGFEDFMIKSLQRQAESEDLE